MFSCHYRVSWRQNVVCEFGNPPRTDPLLWLSVSWFCASHLWRSIATSFVLWPSLIDIRTEMPDAAGERDSLSRKFGTWAEILRGRVIWSYPFIINFLWVLLQPFLSSLGYQVFSQQMAFPLSHVSSSAFTHHLVGFLSIMPLSPFHNHRAWITTQGQEDCTATHRPLIAHRNSHDLFKEQTICVSPVRSPSPENVK